MKEFPKENTDTFGKTQKGKGIKTYIISMIFVSEITIKLRIYVKKSRY